MAIVSLDLNQRIASCNPAFESLFGYTRKEVIGADLDLLIAPDDWYEESASLTRQVVQGARSTNLASASAKTGA